MTDKDEAATIERLNVMLDRASADNELLRQEVARLRAVRIETELTTVADAIARGAVAWQWRPEPNGDTWFPSDPPDDAELRKYPGQFRPLHSMFTRADFSIAKQLRLSIERNARLQKRLVALLRYITAIRDATKDGRICDDVAWSPQRGETLHDYCEAVLNIDASDARADLFCEPGR